MAVDQLLVRLANRVNPRGEYDFRRIGMSPTKFLWRTSLAAALPKSVTLRATMPSGVRLRGKNSPGYGGRGVFIMRDWVEPELQLLPGLLRSGGSMIDVGCCVGSYTFEAARLVGPSGGVLAVDPNPDAVATIRRGMEENDLRNVVAVAVAADSGFGLSHFDVENQRPDSRGLLDADTGPLCGRVLSVALDDLVEQLGWDSVDLIKIDAEGGEARVLQGSTRILHECRPVLIAETAIAEFPMIEEYESWVWEGSRNQVLVPSERSDVAGHLESKGYHPA